MSNRNPERWMNGIIGPDTVKVDGAQIAIARKSINLVGATQADDPENDATNVAVPSSTTNVVRADYSVSLEDLQALGATSAGTIDLSGATLDTNSYVFGVPFVRVFAALAGPSLTASTVSVFTDTDGTNYTALMGAVSTATNTGGPGGVRTAGAVGSNPYPVRGQQQLKLRFTLTGCNFADLTDGNLVLTILTVEPLAP